MPVAAMPRSASTSTAASGASAAGRVEEEEGEDRHDDQLQHQQVDEERRRLGGEEDAAVDRGEADRVEAALLALGDEEAVDAEQGGEEQGRPEHAGGEAAGEAGAVEAEAEDDEGGDGEERHRRQRLQGAQLGPQVLGEDRGEGACDARGSCGHRPPAGLEAQHPVGLGFEALGVVADDDAGAARRRADQRPRQLAALGVEVGVGLVEQQQLGLVQDAAADRQPLAHPGGELGDALLGAALHRDRAEQRVDPRLGGLAAAARAGGRGSAGSRGR